MFSSIGNVKHEQFVAGALSPSVFESLVAVWTAIRLSQIYFEKLLAFTNKLKWMQRAASAQKHFWVQMWETFN